jgi:hypothetical protein
VTVLGGRGGFAPDTTREQVSEMPHSAATAVTFQAAPLPVLDAEPAAVRICYFFAGPSRRTDLGEELKKLFLAEGMAVDCNSATC